MRDDRKGLDRSLEKKEDQDTDISNRSGRNEIDSRRKLEPGSYRERESKRDREGRNFDDRYENTSHRDRYDDKAHKSDSKRHVCEEYKDRNGVQTLKVERKHK